MLEKIKLSIKKKNQKNRIKKCHEIAISLKQTDFSIIASSCLSGIIYHDLERQFLTPTININFRNNDFYYFASHLKEYIASNMEEFVIQGSTFPHGILKVSGLPDVVINFPHDSSFIEAKKSWDRRKQRINYNYIRVMAVQKDISQETIDLFSNIPYKKVLFYGINHGGRLTCECVHNDFLEKETQTTTRSIAGFSGLTSKRNFDSFNWAKFIKEN